jgi:5-methylcytosine-specific restriction endonuclease McrA
LEDGLPFLEVNPSREDYWRSVVLFGLNVASYKFALAKSLLEIATTEQNFVRLEELALPFARHISEHLKMAKKQATSFSSRFLDAVRRFNSGELDQSNLLQKTVALGFNNVIDAFHIVSREPIPVRFFIDDRKERSGIIITDELFKLKETVQFSNLSPEAEGRWRLVETAWELGLKPSLLTVHYDPQSSLFFARNELLERIDVTSSRDALDGYQKGKCFYCFRDISIAPGAANLADVDHFIPHTLAARSETPANLNGVWNLVLACRGCNRGVRGKSARVPQLKYLERRHKRNNFLIESHHPLRETLIAQTGQTEALRQRYLQDQYANAKLLLIHDWTAADEMEAAF